MSCWCEWCVGRAKQLVALIFDRYVVDGQQSIEQSTHEHVHVHTHTDKTLVDPDTDASTRARHTTQHAPRSTRHNTKRHLTATGDRVRA